MPNSTIDPHGNVTASATPLSMTSRTCGALACTLVPPRRVTRLAITAWAGRIFMPLMSSGTTIFLVREWKSPGSWMKEKQNFTSFISSAAYFRYHSSSAANAVLVGQKERQRRSVDHREAAGLIAGADVGDVGDAVARHVVMVERLAELLGGKNLEVQGAAGGLVDRGRPVLERFLQRMRGRCPRGNLQIEALVLRLRRRAAKNADSC